MVIFEGARSSKLASRAGAAAPGSSGPGPALPAKGGWQRQQAAFGTRPALGRGGIAGLNPTRGLRSREKLDFGAPASLPGRAHGAKQAPARRAEEGSPRQQEARQTSGPGRWPKRDKTSRLLCRKAQVPLSSSPELRGPRLVKPTAGKAASEPKVPIPGLASPTAGERAGEKAGPRAARPAARGRPRAASSAFPAGSHASLAVPRGPAGLRRLGPHAGIPLQARCGSFPGYRVKDGRPKRLPEAPRPGRATSASRPRPSVLFL